MANIKISQLPAASTVTADVDVLPIVHFGVTEKVTPNQIVNKVLEAPGEIGGTIPSDATFATLTAESSVFLNPANADVELSPTGSGRTLILPEAGAIINPGVLSYMDNVAIGGTTPQAAVFTTLTSNSTTTLNGTTIPASKTLVDTDSVQTLSSKYYLNPRIWDYDQNNYYRISPVSPGLATDVYCYLPILTGNDYFSFRNFTETLTNKTISGLSNTLTDIPNSSFQYSSITLGSTSISLGGTASSITGLALIGGTVNNTAIGGTTASSGAFTTLSSTGNTTLGNVSDDTLTINGTAVACPNNLNFDSNTLFIDATNNRVGIGTGTPSSRLSFGNTIGVDFALYEGAGGANIYGLGMGGNGTSGDPYRTKIYSNGNEVAAFSSNGLVGIGAFSSGARVEVAGTIRSTTQTAPTSGSGTELLYTGGTGYLLSYNRSTASPTPLVINGSTIRFDSSTTSAVFIDASGNVGIGVTPATRFDVSGGTGGSRIQFALASSEMAAYAINPTNTAYADASWRALTHSYFIGATRAMTLDASGNLGIGVTPNNSYTACLQLKSGITFPATQVASTNANTLDDYEEGTWTPSVGGDATYTLQDAYYVKVGKVVYVTGRLLINVLGTGSASTVSGLPFVAANTYARGILSLGTSATVASPAFYSLECEVANNTSTFIFIGRTAAGNASAQATVLANGSNIQFSGFYFTS